MQDQARGREKPYLCCVLHCCKKLVDETILVDVIDELSEKNNESVSEVDSEDST